MVGCMAGWLVGWPHLFFVSFSRERDKWKKRTGEREEEREREREREGWKEDKI
jgi:hypothetical protein